MTKKNLTYSLVLFLILAALLYHYLLIMFVAQKHVDSLKAVFVSENAKLGDLPKILGSSHGPVTKSCTVAKNMHFSTELTCFADENYVSISGIDSQRLYRFSPQILSSLSKNGWSVDNKTEYKNAWNKLIDVAYHKNIGPVSCNLEISSSSGAFYINFYSCSRNVIMPDFNLRTRTFGV